MRAWNPRPVHPTPTPGLPASPRQDPDGHRDSAAPQKTAQEGLLGKVERRKPEQRGTPESPALGSCPSQPESTHPSRQLAARPPRSNMYVHTPRHAYTTHMHKHTCTQVKHCKYTYIQLHTQHRCAHAHYTCPSCIHTHALTGTLHTAALCGDIAHDAFTHMPSRAPYAQPHSVETLMAHIHWRSLCAELRVSTGLRLTLPHPGPHSQLRATHTHLWRDTG